MLQASSILTLRIFELGLLFPTHFQGYVDILICFRVFLFGQLYEVGSSTYFAFEYVLVLYEFAVSLYFL